MTENNATEIAYKNGYNDCLQKILNKDKLNSLLDRLNNLSDNLDILKNCNYPYTEEISLDIEEFTEIRQVITMSYNILKHLDDNRGKVV